MNPIVSHTPTSLQPHQPQVRTKGMSCSRRREWWFVLLCTAATLPTPSRGGTSVVLTGRASYDELGGLPGSTDHSATYASVEAQEGVEVVLVELLADVHTGDFAEDIGGALDDAADSLVFGTTVAQVLGLGDNATLSSVEKPSAALSPTAVLNATSGDTAVRAPSSRSEPVVATFAAGSAASRSPALNVTHLRPCRAYRVTVVYAASAETAVISVGQCLSVSRMAILAVVSGGCLAACAVAVAAYAMRERALLQDRLPGKGDDDGSDGDGRSPRTDRLPTEFGALAEAVGMRGEAAEILAGIEDLEEEVESALGMDIVDSAGVVRKLAKTDKVQAAAKGAKVMATAKSGRPLKAQDVAAAAAWAAEARDGALQVQDVSEEVAMLHGGAQEKRAADDNVEGAYKEHRAGASRVVPTDDDDDEPTAHPAQKLFAAAQGVSTGVPTPLRTLTQPQPQPQPAVRDDGECAGQVAPRTSRLLLAGPCVFCVFVGAALYVVPLFGDVVLASLALPSEALPLKLLGISCVVAACAAVPTTCLLAFLTPPSYSVSAADAAAYRALRSATTGGGDASRGTVAFAEEAAEAAAATTGAATALLPTAAAAAAAAAADAAELLPALLPALDAERRRKILANPDSGDGAGAAAAAVAADAEGGAAAAAAAAGSQEELQVVTAGKDDDDDDGEVDAAASDDDAVADGGGRVAVEMVSVSQTVEVVEEYIEQAAGADALAARLKARTRQSEAAGHPQRSWGGFGGGGGVGGGQSMGGMGAELPRPSQAFRNVPVNRMQMAGLGGGLGGVGAGGALPAGGLFGTAGLFQDPTRNPLGPGSGGLFGAMPGMPGFGGVASQAMGVSSALNAMGYRETEREQLRAQLSGKHGEQAAREAEEKMEKLQQELAAEKQQHAEAIEEQKKRFEGEAQAKQGELEETRKRMDEERTRVAAEADERIEKMKSELAAGPLQASLVVEEVTHHVGLDGAVDDVTDRVEISGSADAVSGVAAGVVAGALHRDRPHGGGSPSPVEELPSTPATQGGCAASAAPEDDVDDDGAALLAVTPLRVLLDGRHDQLGEDFADQLSDEIGDLYNGNVSDLSTAGDAPIEVFFKVHSKAAPDPAALRTLCGLRVLEASVVDEEAAAGETPPSTPSETWRETLDAVLEVPTAGAHLGIPVMVSAQSRRISSISVAVEEDEGEVSGFARLIMFCLFALIEAVVVLVLSGQVSKPLFAGVMAGTVLAACLVAVFISYSIAGLVFHLLVVGCLVAYLIANDYWGQAYGFVLGSVFLLLLFAFSAAKMKLKRRACIAALLAVGAYDWWIVSDLVWLMLGFCFALLIVDVVVAVRHSKKKRHGFWMLLGLAALHSAFLDVMLQSYEEADDLSMGTVFYPLWLAGAAIARLHMTFTGSFAPVFLEHVDVKLTLAAGTLGTLWCSFHIYDAAIALTSVTGVAIVAAEALLVYAAVAVPTWFLIVPRVQQYTGGTLTSSATFACDALF